MYSVSKYQEVGFGVVEFSSVDVESRMAFHGGGSCFVCPVKQARQNNHATKLITTHNRMVHLYQVGALVQYAEPILEVPHLCQNDFFTRQESYRWVDLNEISRFPVFEVKSV